MNISNQWVTGKEVMRTRQKHVAPLRILPLPPPAPRRPRAPPRALACLPALDGISGDTVNVLSIFQPRMSRVHDICLLLL